MGHKDKPAQGWYCHICESSFDTQADLRAHQAEGHLK